MLLPSDSGHWAGAGFFFTAQARYSKLSRRSMKIAITGAGGLVGSHLARHLSADHTVLALKHRDLEITDREAVRRWVLSERPSLLINCAVLNVDECERDPALAQAINVAGP